MTPAAMSGRRQLIAAGLSFGVVGGAVGLIHPASLFAASRVATPAQALGPFYPRTLPLDRDADLATVAGAGARAQGEIVHLAGRVLDEDERAVAGARVEIWQCNAFGRYHHPRDTRDAPLDPGFQGYGETVSAADGAWRFRTIRPVAYPGRAPHIHFIVTAPGGGILVTQMYVEGEPLNIRDGLLNSVRDPGLRRSLIVELIAAPELEPGALGGRFEIVLGRNTRP